MQALLYGFQFPHHGRFSSFLALSREFEKSGLGVCHVPYPQLVAWMPKRIRAIGRKEWFKKSEYRLKPAFAAGRLVHYFYPENSLFKAADWKKKGSLVLSCHHPVSELMAIKKRGMLLPFFEGLKAADIVVVMASDGVDEYRELAPNSQVLCIPHGVDTSFFSAGEPELPSDKCFRILTVGNWLRDYDLWAKVVDHVVAECPEVEFSLLANPYRLVAAMKNINSETDHIRLLSGISDEQLCDEYRRADVIFLPLQNAWANNALLEGMACGRPVMVTDLPATREYAGDASCFIEKGSVDSAVTELLRLRTDKDARDALGAEARTHVANRYSWPLIVQRHIELYACLIESGC